MGTKTGQLKLRMVYDMFLERFPGLSNCISFNDIDFWVKTALEWLNHELETNPKLREYVYGDSKNGNENSAN